MICRSRARTAAALLALSLLVAPAWSAETALVPPAGLERDGSAAVAAVIDGDSLTLTDGRTVRLVGIQAPKLAKGRQNFPEWPLAREAKLALEELVANQTVGLRFGGAKSDRYGRVLAQLDRPDGLWIQGELIRRGLARVYTFPDNHAAAAPMYALEQEARAAGRGLWADPFYRVRTPDQTLQYVGRFELVQGRIVEGARTDHGVFLNFDRDWRTAFTLRINTEAQKLFRADGIDPLAIRGTQVRVRGYIRRDRDRAIIDITHPEEIERL